MTRNLLTAACVLFAATRAFGAPPTPQDYAQGIEIYAPEALPLVETPLPDASRVNLEAFCGENKIAKLEESGRIRKACQNGISEHSPFADFRDYLEVLLAVSESKSLSILLMLDEFDKLQDGIDNGVTSPQVPENIRFLIQSYPRFSAILTGSRRLKKRTSAFERPNMFERRSGLCQWCSVPDWSGTL